MKISEIIVESAPAGEIDEGIRTRSTDKSFIDYTSLFDRGGRSSLNLVGVTPDNKLFQHPQYPGIVVRVFKNDRGYSEWVKWAVNHKNNAYVPRFIPHPDGDLIKIFKHKNNIKGKVEFEYYGIVFMEKLQRLDSKQAEKFHAKIFKYLPAADRNKFFNFSLDYLPAIQWQRIAAKSRSVDPDLSEIALEMSRLLIKFGNRYNPYDRWDDVIAWDPKRKRVVFIGRNSPTKFSY